MQRSSKKQHTQEKKHYLLYKKEWTFQKRKLEQNWNSFEQNAQRQKRGKTTWTGFSNMSFKNKAPQGRRIEIGFKKEQHSHKKKCQKNMCKKNETGFQNTLEFPKNDFK